MALSENGSLEFTLQSLCLQGSLWYMYGKSALHSLFIQILVNLNTQDPVKQGLHYKGEPLAIAISNIAMLFIEKVRYALKSQKNVESKYFFI